MVFSFLRRNDSPKSAEQYRKRYARAQGVRQTVTILALIPVVASLVLAIVLRAHHKDREGVVIAHIFLASISTILYAAIAKTIHRSTIDDNDLRMAIDELLNLIVALIWCSMYFVYRFCTIPKAREAKDGARFAIYDSIYILTSVTCILQTVAIWSLMYAESTRAKYQKASRERNGQPLHSL